MWCGLKRQRAAPVRSAAFPGASATPHNCPVEGVPHWTSHKTTSSLRSWTSPEGLTPTSGSKLKAWGVAVLHTLPKAFQDLASRWGLAPREKQSSPSLHSSPLSSASVSDLESHMSEHQQDAKPGWPSESADQGWPQLQLSLSSLSPRMPFAKQLPSRPSCSPSSKAGVKRVWCPSMDQQSVQKRRALNPSGRSPRAIHLIEFTASGQASGHADACESAAAEKESLRASNEVLLLSLQKQPSSQRLSCLQDIGLASAVLQGSALVRVHSALSVLAARELLPDVCSVIEAKHLCTEMNKTEAVLSALFCLCRRARLDPSAVASCPPVLLTFLWILQAFHRASASSARSAVLSMQATGASSMPLWKPIMVKLQPILLQRINWHVVVKGEEMRYALDLLQDCTSARVSEWAFYTRPEGHQLFTPTLQLRCNAVEATANILKKFLPNRGAATPSSTARSEHLDSFQSASNTTLPCHSDEKPSHRTSAAAAATAAHQHFCQANTQIQSSTAAAPVTHESRRLHLRAPGLLLQPS